MNNSSSDKLSKSIAKTLNESIELSGKASLVVCGGNSPLPIYQKLSLADLDWSKVSVYLGDDRLLLSDHIDSNENLLRKNLLINNAKSAKFYPLVQPRINIKDLILPFDIVLLGLGLDGHFASLFPEQVKLSSAFSIDADPDLICSDIPLGSPSYKRISMNLALLLNTKRCILLVTNSDKRLVLEKASTNNKMPLHFLINQDKTKLEFSDIDF